MTLPDPLLNIAVFVLLLVVLALAVAEFAVLWYARSMVSQRDDALDQLEGKQADLDHADTKYRALVAVSEAHPLVARRKLRAVEPSSIEDMSDVPVRLRP